MSILYERLDYLCKVNWLKGAKMCRDLGFSKSMMTDLKMGRKKGVNAETAHKIAEYFGVSVEFLLGEEETHPTWNDEVCTLYERIQSICEERGIKVGKMCTDIGISKGILTDLKIGRTIKKNARKRQIKKWGESQKPISPVFYLISM